MNLILKFHPKQLAYFINRDTYGIIPVDTNLNISADRFKGDLESATSGACIENVILEKPFLKLLGSDHERKTLAKNVIHVQRHFGALLYIIHLLFRNVPQHHISSKVAREKVFGRVISKDQMLSEARCLLNNCEACSPLALLSLYDCLVLDRFHREHIEKK